MGSQWSVFTVAQPNDSATLEFTVLGSQFTVRGSLFTVSFRGSARGKCGRTGVRASVDGVDKVDTVDRVDAATAPTVNCER